jgi:hypothetical protein
MDTLSNEKARPVKCVRARLQRESKLVARVPTRSGCTTQRDGSPAQRMLHRSPDLLARSKTLHGSPDPLARKAYTEINSRAQHLDFFAQET